MRNLFILMLVAASLSLASCTSTTSPSVVDAKTNLPGSWKFTRSDNSTFTTTISIAGSMLTYDGSEYTATFDGATAVGKKTWDLGGQTITTTVTFTMTSPTALNFKEADSYMGISYPATNYTAVKQ